MAFVRNSEIGEDFVLVTAMDETNITFLHGNKKAETMLLDDFLSQAPKWETTYKDIIWMAEPNAESGEVGYEEKLKEEKGIRIHRMMRIAGLVLIIGLVLSANMFLSSSLFSFGIISLLKLIGLGTAIALLAYEIDKDNAFVKNICSAGGKSNCDAVLGSKASKIFGISWGEVGFFYFATTTIGLFLPQLSYESKTTAIVLANAVAVPYIFFSIYYQWKVVKQWCPLCLAVQGVLLTELIWGLSFVWASFNIEGILSAQTGHAALFALLAPVVLWYSIKPALIKIKDHDLYLNAYKRLQYNPEIFNSLLNSRRRLRMDGKP